MKNSYEKLINWNELSRLITGNKSNIRAGYVPNRYKDKINNLFCYIEDWHKGNKRNIEIENKVEDAIILNENSNKNVQTHNEYGYSNSQIEVIKKTVAKGTTETELAHFMSVCLASNLNPFLKEIWCYKDKKGNLLIFAGRDGFLTKAQQDPNYNGIRSSEVCKNDIIELDIPNGKIAHKINPKEDRGAIIGGYAIVFRKDGEPTIEWADFKTYNKGINVWTTHPSAMIKKVSEASALKKAFGISGIQSEHEFSVKNGVAIPIKTMSKAHELNDALS